MALLKRLGGNEPKKEVVRVNDHVDQPKVKKGYRNLEIESQLHNYLVEEIKKNNDINDENISTKMRELAQSFFDNEAALLSFEQKEAVIQVVESELTGYGPITPLLNDPTVSEVMVNGPFDVYCEKNGKLVKSDVHFRDNNHVSRVIERIVSPLGRRIDESVPMVDARLPDGSRVNAIIPPLALNGPTITIRKFSKIPFTIENLKQFGTLSEEMAEFIEGCVKARLNIFISGGTGSGKTSTLNVLSSFIPNDERIVTIEDAAELKLSQDHVVSLESRPPNLEGQGAITIRDLVKNSLRMRPDRVIIGEVRSGEALDMLQAMNTGHDGSLGTGHANSPRDMIARLETMVLMAGMDLPVRAIREQIAGALDLIIQQTRMKDGTRKITHITEVLGMEGDMIVLQDIFTFRETGVSMDGKLQGKFVSTGIRPYCIDTLEHYGVDIPTTWFNEEW